VRRAGRGGPPTHARRRHAADLRAAGLGVEPGLLAAALLLAVTGCSREPAYAYPPEFVENFVAACRTHAPEPACRCAIDRIRDTFPFEEFRDHDRRMADGTMPTEVAAVVRDCGAE
jgi:hypothetical protein